MSITLFIWFSTTTITLIVHSISSVRSESNLILSIACWVTPRASFFHLVGDYATWTTVVPFLQWLCYPDGTCSIRTVMAVCKWWSCYIVDGSTTWMVVVLWPSNVSVCEFASISLSISFCFVLCCIYPFVLISLFFSLLQGGDHLTPKSIVLSIITSCPCCLTPYQFVVCLALI